jgi:hypothetical protein
MVIGIKNLINISKHEEMVKMFFGYGNKIIGINSINENGLLLDKDIIGVTHNKFMPYNYLMDEWGPIWYFTAKVNGEEEHLEVQFGFSEEDKKKFHQENTPKELAKQDFEDMASDDELELNENSSDDLTKEIYDEIEMRMSHNMDSLPFSEINEIAEIYNVDFEAVLNIMQSYLIDRSKKEREELKSAVAETMSELEKEGNDNPNFNEFVSKLNKTVEFEFEHPIQNIESEFKKQTTNPNQLALTLEIRKLVRECFNSLSEEAKELEEERIANSDARDFVERKENFVGTHTFGEDFEDGSYVVCSYAQEFPIFIYDSKKDKWYQNGSDFVHNGEIIDQTKEHVDLLRPSVKMYTKPVGEMNEILGSIMERNGVAELSHKSVYPGDK